jgi:hypothetical protein
MKRVWGVVSSQSISNQYSVSRPHSRSHSHRMIEDENEDEDEDDNKTEH